MTKSLITFVTVAMVLLFTSAYYAPVADGRVGYHAPSLNVGNGDESLSLASLQGQYVVVTFWSSSQPQSRFDNIRYSRLAEQIGTFRHMSVNLADDAEMVSVLSHVDGLESGSVYVPASGEADRLAHNWRQQGRYCSFLISADGKIALVNPTAGQLAEL